MVGLVYTSMLFMVVPLIGALDSLDDTLIEAAYDLGGNGWSILRQIIIPHAAPGIVAGCIVVFMLTLGNYLTPTLLGGKNSLWFTEQIYTQFITRFNWEQGAAFGFLLLVLSSAIVWVGPETVRPAVRRRDAARMIPSLPRPAWLRVSTVVYACCSSPSCSCRWPWWRSSHSTTPRTRRPPGAVSRWTGSSAMTGNERVGLFADGPLLASLWTSVVVASWVTVLSVLVGTPTPSCSSAPVSGASRLCRC
jgi:ABC-type spermidine/putrescine transport system permease subunit I